MSRTQVEGWYGSIRQASGADVDAIAAFLAGLSPNARYLRFFTGAPKFSGAMLSRLAGRADNVDALVAAAGDVIIGHAMAVDTVEPFGFVADRGFIADGGVVADIGVVVADGWQGCGVGSALVRVLTARALQRGVTAFAMDVLAQNRRVLSMIAGSWPDATYRRSGLSVTVRAGLPVGRPADAFAARDATGTGAAVAPARVAAGTEAAAEPGVVVGTGRPVAPRHEETWGDAGFSGGQCGRRRREPAGAGGRSRSDADGGRSRSDAGGRSRPGDAGAGGRPGCKQPAPLIPVGGSRDLRGRRRELDGLAFFEG